MLINGYVSDDKLNQEEVLIVHSINSVGCKNYGLAADLVDKYPYAETAGGRYCDSNLKCIAREEDRTPEGSCLIRPAPLYIKGPKIASLVTQFGLKDHMKKIGSLRRSLEIVDRNHSPNV